MILFVTLSSAHSTTVTESLQDSVKTLHQTAAADSERCCSSPNKNQNSSSHHSSSHIFTLTSCLLVYQALNGFSSKHKIQSDLLLRYEASRPLRSSGPRLLSVPRVRTKHGEAAFLYYKPQIWNKVPENCSSAPTLTSFKSTLKTF